MDSGRYPTKPLMYTGGMKTVFTFELQDLFVERVFLLADWTVLVVVNVLLLDCLNRQRVNDLLRSRRRTSISVLKKEKRRMSGLSECATERWREEMRQRRRM